MLLQPNTQLGPYRIVNLLGEGGMGEVYRAQDTRLGRDVAIKILTSVVARDSEQLQRFAQEARAAGMLNHPNLLTIFDIGTSKGTPFIISELLEGETLRDRINVSALPPRRSVEYALQIANGLAAAHEKGIVHRDLKPENVFITRDDRVKILDFGIAKLNLPTTGESTFKMAATEPGMVLGTVGYMSPEQVRGENVDQRSDIFSFGAILYEMLTGSRAFKRDSAIETLSAILKEEPPELSSTLPNIPLPLEKLVQRCLEKDRGRRFQNARDLAFHLDTLVHATTGAAAARVPTPPSGVVEAVDATERFPTSRRAPAQMTTPRPATESRVAPRPTPTSQPSAIRPPISAHPMRKPRRISTVLLGLFFVVAILGALYGGYYYANAQHRSATEVEFHRITFRRGEVRAARFGPDGETIVYSASWNGGPLDLFVASSRNPEARSLGIGDAEVTSVSKNAELALLLHRDRQSGLGTLARVSIAGGIPREIANNVAQADWSPDGDELAVIRQNGNNFQLEYPIGKVLYRTAHALRDVRVSPSGKKVAFVEPSAGAFDIVVLENGKADPLAHGFKRGVVGMAWKPDESELWITATDNAAPPALYAVAMNGDTRLVSRLTGSMRLYDIATNGSVLMMHSTWRATLSYQAPGETVERDASWLDWSIVSDISADGKTLLFNETREGGGASRSVFIRRADAASPVRIGDGFGDALSPDSAWVLTHQGANLVLTPTGPGEPRQLKIEGAFDLGAVWLDSAHVFLAGAQKGDKYGIYLIDTASETAKRVTTADVSGDAFRPFAVSPDGSVVAAMNAQDQVTLYPVSGGPPVAVAGALGGEIPINFSPDGSQLYVARPSGVPVQVARITLASGLREIWRELTPSDAAGVYRIAPIVMTRDGSAYAYDTLRNLSDLYVVDGLR